MADIGSMDLVLDASRFQIRDAGTTGRPFRLYEKSGTGLYFVASYKTASAAISAADAHFDK